MNKQQKIRIGIIAAGFVLVIAIVAVVMVTVGGNTNANAYNSHMELAQQYLDDLEYEQAIAEYKAAIEIEPSNKEAYLALADIYVQQGDYEAAITVLNQGLKETIDERLAAALKELEEQYVEVREEQKEQATSAESNADKEINNKQEIGYYASGAIRYIHEYRENGIIVKTTQYYESGAIQYIHEYGENGVIANYSQYDENGRIQAIFECDEKGRTIKATSYYESGAISGIYEFDENGNEIKVTKYFERGAVQNIYECNESGIREKDIWYYESGAVEGIYEFDENGYYEKSIWYYESGEIQKICEYNEAGVKETYYNLDGTVQGVLQLGPF